MGEDPRSFLPELPGLVGAIPMLGEAAAGLGLVTLTPDVDGIVRRVPLVGLVGGQLLPSLALETIRDRGGRRQGVPAQRPQRDHRDLARADDDTRSIRRGAPGSATACRTPISTYAAADVLAGRVPPGRLKGHIVFIGASAAGLGDIKPAPIVGAMPGVEIQASLLQTLVSGSILRRPVGLVQIENLSLLVLGLLLAWAGPFLRASFLPALLGLVVAGGLGDHVVRVPLP